MSETTATTPNGTKYNLRQRERRNLSHSFISESPPQTSAADHHHRSRNNSSSKKKSYVAHGQVRGRPSIHRPTALDIAPHFSEGPQTIISGNVPPPQNPVSGNVQPAETMTGCVTSRPTIFSARPSGSGQISPLDVQTFETKVDKSGEASFTNADSTSVKTVVESSGSSLAVNAPDNLAAKSLLSKPTDCDSSQGSAKFLEASSFYGSATNRPPSPRMGTKALNPPIQPVVSTALPTVSSRATLALPVISMATSALSKVQPIGSTPTSAFATIHPVVPMTTASAPSDADIASRGNISRTSLEQTSHPLQTPPRSPVRSVLFGPDVSPSLAHRNGEFSDDDNVEPESQLRRRSPNLQRNLGGLDGPPEVILPQRQDRRRPSGGKRNNNSTEGLVILMIIFAFLMVVGGIYRHFFGEVYEGERAREEENVIVEEPIVPTTETAGKHSEPIPPPPPSPPPALTAAEFESRIEQISIEKQKDVADLRDSLQKALKDDDVRDEEAKIRERRLNDGLRQLTDSTKQFEIIQRKFENEMRNYRMEMNLVGKTQGENDASLGEVRGFVSKLNDIVETLAEKVKKLENSVKTVIVKHVTEVQSLRAMMHVSRSPPTVNETEILEKMELVQEQMRESIGDSLADVFRKKFDEISVDSEAEFSRMKEEFSTKECQLKRHLESLVVQRVAASIPHREEKTPRLDEDAVKHLIEKALREKEEDSQDEAEVDYALDSQGGSVIDESSSETYTASPASWSFFGLPVWYRVNGPRTIIGADKHPGQCWPMAGSSGHVLVKLSHDIVLTGFSLDHISRRVSPTNTVDSAPKDFHVQVFGSELEVVSLGPFRYNENATKTNQHFDLDPMQRLRASYVRLHVDSNYGHPEYTCIYRFRVHGIYTGG